MSNAANRGLAPRTDGPEKHLPLPRVTPIRHPNTRRGRRKRGRRVLRPSKQGNLENFFRFAGAVASTAFAAAFRMACGSPVGW